MTSGTHVTNWYVEICWLLWCNKPSCEKFHVKWLVSRCNTFCISFPQLLPTELEVENLLFYILCKWYTVFHHLFHSKQPPLHSAALDRVLPNFWYRHYILYDDWMTDFAALSGMEKKVLDGVLVKDVALPEEGWKTSSLVPVGFQRRLAHTVAWLSISVEISLKKHTEGRKWRSVFS